MPVETAVFLWLSEEQRGQVSNHSMMIAINSSLISLAMKPLIPFFC